MNDALHYILLGICLLLLAATLLAVRLLKKEREKQKDRRGPVQQGSQADSLRLETLEARLDPHLLKNIFNSMQSHAYQTYFAIDKLASVLDYILYESRNKFVTPKEEIGFALNLIEVNKIKLSPLFELNVKMKIDEEDPVYTRQLLAPMISIDLVENAFKHADLQSPEAFISVVFECRNGHFQLTVSNKISSSPPLQKRRSGLGAETLEQRLQLIYRQHFTLERFTEGDVYIAHLTINLREYHAQMHIAG